MPTLRRVAHTGPWTWHGWQNGPRGRDGRVVHQEHARSAAESRRRQGAGRLPGDPRIPPRTPTATPDGGLSPAAKRGEAVFRSAKAACNTCHGGPEFTDGKIHIVGLEEPDDAYRGYNPPSLRGVYDKDPYLHDGRSQDPPRRPRRPHNPDNVTGLGTLNGHGAGRPDRVPQEPLREEESGSRRRLLQSLLDGYCLLPSASRLSQRTRLRSSRTRQVAGSGPLAKRVSTGQPGSNDVPGSGESPSRGTANGSSVGGSPVIEVGRTARVAARTGSASPPPARLGAGRVGRDRHARGSHARRCSARSGAAQRQLEHLDRGRVSRVDLDRPGLAVAEDQVDAEEADEAERGRQGRRRAPRSAPRLEDRDRPGADAPDVGERAPRPADPLPRDPRERSPPRDADEERREARAVDPLLVVRRSRRRPVVAVRAGGSPGPPAEASGLTSQLPSRGSPSGLEPDRRARQARRGGRPRPRRRVADGAEDRAIVAPERPLPGDPVDQVRDGSPGPRCRSRGRPEPRRRGRPGRRDSRRRRRGERGRPPPGRGRRRGRRRVGWRPARSAEKAAARALAPRIRTSKGPRSGATGIDGRAIRQAMASPAGSGGDHRARPRPVSRP